MYNHYEYCEMLARSLKAISHTDKRCKYFEATHQTELHQLEQNITNASGTLLIAVDEQLSNFDFGNDSLIEKPFYSIVFAKQTKSTDARTIKESQQFCKELANQTISKILNDARAYKHNCDKIDASTFSIEGFGPIGGLFYGVMLSFTLAEGRSFEIDKQYWNE